MRLKSFHAANMAEAMTAVRAELGEDAIIVSMRDEEGGVRITAAIEPAFEPIDREADDTQAKLNLSSFHLLPEVDHTEALADLLYRHSVPARMADEMIGAAIHHSAAPDLKSLLVDVLAQLLPFDAAAPGGDKPVMLVGPPGVGKTLTTAKLAAQAHMDGRRVMVFTTDTVRAGGVEQLEAFTKVLGVPMAAAETGGALRDGVDAVRGEMDLILIDTAGFNPFHMPDIAELVTLIKSLGGLNAIDAVLVLPAGVDAAEAADIAGVYQKLGIKRLIMTRLDCARRLGGVITACLTGPFQLLALSQSSRVADGLSPLSPESFADILLSPPKGAS